MRDDGGRIVRAQLPGQRHESRFRAEGPLESAGQHAQDHQPAPEAQNDRAGRNVTPRAVPVRSAWRMPPH